jgi:hypothetical protein
MIVSFFIGNHFFKLDFLMLRHSLCKINSQNAFFQAINGTILKLFMLSS